MGYEKQQPDQGAAQPAINELVAESYAGLKPLAERLYRLDSRIAEIGTSGDRSISAAARRLRKQLREFEPSVTMIGQVKAGKTTLVNAMAGWPGLLPADVNPWTSVVTSIHMAPRSGVAGNQAKFSFFDEDEWNRLLQRGGRVGELASRAGADDELEKVRRQLEEMREKSRARLGKKFELLLGQSHEYDRFDEELIERYVCLGDEFEDEDGEASGQGRFADITKSAELHFGRPEIPVGLCIRDTPGVNDTFMIREQITIHSLRESKLCVVVLSAHQALSSVDLALIRMISNVKARDVIIFVNRIDELSDPGREVPEIRNSISETLKRYDGPTDAEIIFGSGFWANHALSGDYHSLGLDSAKTLLNWAEAVTAQTGVEKTSIEELIWHLSGLPALGEAIAGRIDAGAGARLEESIEKAIHNLDQGMSASRTMDAALVSGAKATMTPDEIKVAFDGIELHYTSALQERFGRARQEFYARAESSHRSFLSRATESLIKHLEVYGEREVWEYDPSGLRMLLRSGYQVFARSATRASTDLLNSAATDISSLYQRAFQLDDDGFKLEAPQVPQAPPPVVLGQTIALDLMGNWWTRFWRRQQGYQKFADKFSKLIHEETLPIVAALKSDNADAFELSVRGTLLEFLSGQRAILADLAERSATAEAAPQNHSGTAMAPDDMPLAAGRG